MSLGNDALAFLFVVSFNSSYPFEFDWEKGTTNEGEGSGSSQRLIIDLIEGELPHLLRNRAAFGVR